MGVHLHILSSAQESYLFFSFEKYPGWSETREIEIK